MKNVIIPLFLAGWMAAVYSPRASAQATDGNVVGAVLDATGAAVPTASIELENSATGARIGAAVNAGGEYRIAHVPVGIYRVTAKAGGFAASTLGNVNVDLNKTVTVNFKLQVGAVSTTVDVTESGVAIDTTTAQIASNFDSHQALDLPQSSFVSKTGVAFGALNLALLGSGVASSGGVGYGIGPSVGGQRPTNNSFNIEGVDNNRKDITGPVVYVPNESTAEFTLLQNQFAPEFGHSSGGQFNTIIKSGTNSLHGSIYEYLQNRNLNAVDQAFANQGITSGQRYDQNRLGATIGGPILKNKLFYFGNFEYIPLGQASTPSSATLSPTAEGYQMLSRIPGLSQTNLSVLQQYLSPAPIQSRTTRVSGVDIPIGILPIVAPNYQNQYVGLASVDYNLSDNDKIRGRYVYNKISAIDIQANLPAFFTFQPTTSNLLAVSEYHTFSPALVNELRLNYNRFNQDVPAGSFNFPGLDAFPNIQIENDLNAQLGPDPNAPQFTIFNSYQLVDNVSWARGRHTFKFGADARKLIAPQSFVQRSRGDYEYTRLELYLQDKAPDDLGERTLGSSPYSGNQIAFYSYVADDWRIRPNLTLNLGLRHEYTTIPYSQRLQSLNALSTVPGVLAFAEPQTQKANFAPRIGIAWSPGNSGRTSIRAGFGMAYDQIYDNLGILSLPPQFNTTVDVTGNEVNFLANGGIPPAVKTGNLSQADARAQTSAWIPDQQVPYSIQWNIGVQHVFHNDYTLEARYLGTRGVHLGTQNRINAASVVTPTQSLPTYLQAPSQAALDALPLTLNGLQALADAQGNTLQQYGFASNITAFLPNGNSMYHGLALQATRRFSHGLQFVGAYTWSHNIDDSTATVFSTLLTPRRPQDFFDMKSERSSSALDRRQRFTLSGVWDLPLFTHSQSWVRRNLFGNITFAGTYTVETPEYATVQSGLDSNLNGDAFGDRAIVNPAGTANAGSDVTPLTNSAGQTVAYLANNPAARYLVAGPGAYPSGGRNTLPLSGINNFDLSFLKRFNITEAKKFEFRAEMYNAFNHPQFTAGVPNNVNLVQRTTSRNFLIPGNPEFDNVQGRIESNARVIQMTLRFMF